MRKTSLIFSVLALAAAGLLVFSGCEIVECGDEECNGTETCETCPEDCGACTGGAQIQFTWYIHGVRGGVDVGYGTGTAQEVCALVQDMSTLTAPPVVQLWIENTGDDVADQRFDFTCSAGTGLTTAEWEAGDSVKYAFALVDAAGTLLSQSAVWETDVLTGGINDFGTVNLYIGDYGPLSVDLQWADKETDAAWVSCADIPVTGDVALGYLLCYGALVSGGCAEGMLYDEVDVATGGENCVDNLTWDIIDFGTYTLVVDGEDSLGTTIWGYECQDLVVDSEQPSSNEFICQIIMTASPTP